jgi:hypothetical protein
MENNYKLLQHDMQHKIRK